MIIDVYGSRMCKTPAVIGKPKVPMLTSVGLIIMLRL